MTGLRIPNKAWVLVGDGRKAVVLTNRGDETFPNLRALSIFRDADNPSTASQGSDRPGTSIDHASGRHSGMEQVDWHEVAEKQFAHNVAATLSRCEQSGDISTLVVVAPPRTLAELRESFSQALQHKVMAEVAKDLTRHPIHEIERILTGQGSR